MRERRLNIADFISRQVVEACVEAGCHERPPARAAGRRYAFIDAAGGSGTDSMTLAIAHAEDGIPVLDAIRERKPPFSPDDGVSALLTDRWGYVFRLTGALAEQDGLKGYAVEAELVHIPDWLSLPIIDDAALDTKA
jgi:hypothetical protein